jgi:hypothetical protein
MFWYPVKLFVRDVPGILVTVHFSELHDVQTHEMVKKLRDLRFPQRDIEYSGLQGRCDDWFIDPHVSKEHTAFMFRGHKVLAPLERFMKAIRFFETSGSSNPAIQRKPPR